MAPVLSEAIAQPPAHRTQRPLGLRRGATAGAKGGTARHRFRRVPPRLRQRLRRLEGPGKNPRREILVAASFQPAVSRGLHAAGQGLLLRRTCEPCRQCDPHGRPGRAGPAHTAARREFRSVDDARRDGAVMREPDPDLRVAVASASLLGESPMWHPRERVLYYCDIPGKRLNRFDPASGELTHWDFATEAASIAPRLDGSLLLAMRDGLFAFDPLVGERKKLASAPYEQSK